MDAKLRLALSSIFVAQSLVAGVARSVEDPKVRNFNFDHVSGEVIVKFSTRSSDVDVNDLLSSVDGTVIHTFRASGAARVKLNSAASPIATKAAAIRLAADPLVEYVEANTIIHLDQADQSGETPNDPRLSELWGMTKISAADAWAINTGSTDVVVGIIDTGVDYTHPEISDNYWNNPGETGTDANGEDKKANGVDDDENGYIDDFRGWDFANDDNDPMDDHNHGTHCAGTIGAKGNNGVGVVGVNWNVGIVGIKFLTGGGSGTTADAIEAIEYGTKIGVKMTSNSWGGGGASDPMKAAIQEAHEAGVLFIAAAGNSSSNNDRSPNYPSNYDVPNVIAVAATQQNDSLASFSSYGATTVDLAAPGVSIISTVRNSGYGSMSGTSMATPHVAGGVALIMAEFPDLDAQEVKSKLLGSVDAVTALRGKVATGGRMNIAKALQP